MIVVTGAPRSGTSMMMRCLEKAGIPMAFEELERPEDATEKFSNPYGFYEGTWNGEDGAIKVFSFMKLKELPNPKFIFMERDINKILASWKDVEGYTARPSKKVILSNKMRIYNYILEFPYIIVNYDTFVKDSASYKDKFYEIFGDTIDFKKLTKGINKKLHTKR